MSQSARGDRRGQHCCMQCSKSLGQCMKKILKKMLGKLQSPCRRINGEGVIVGLPSGLYNSSHNGNGGFPFLPSRSVFGSVEDYW